MVFVGCVRYLEHVGLMASVKTVVGTSAGAISAFLIALGFTADDMAAWIGEHSRTGRLNKLDVTGIIDLPERLGIDDGSGVDGCLRDALVARFGVDDVTFLELAKLSGLNVVVCASNLTLGREEFFCVDSSPDVSVLKALRMSYSLPILMTPIAHCGSLYVDGGLFDNCPLDFPRADSFGRGLAFRIVQDQAPPSCAEVSPTLVDYILLVMNGLMKRSSAPLSTTTTSDTLVVDVHLPPTLSVGMFNVETFGFDVDDELLESHSALGYAAARDSLQCF